MIDASTFTREMLSNPTKLTKAVIDAMEASDTGGGITINDPNNGFVMQLMSNMSVFSKFSEKVDNVNAYFYAQRARNAEQLYPHLSEFDYVNLMASPATLPFIFAMSKDWIIANSVYFDENYNKIVIPATSWIEMGNVIYSMYYPIEILVNRNTGAVTAFYDTTNSNSLYTLKSNMLLDVQEFTQNGINYFQIQFNMYQFQRTIIPFTIGSEQGFVKTIGYEDQFYAAKVYTRNTNGTWAELAYSLTQMYYDYQTPTVILSLLNDANQLKLEIPQIYFDNNQISQTIRVELYTTKGQVNYSLSAADVSGLKAHFDTTSSNFAAPLAQMPTWTILPTTLEVAGGSNIKSYSEMRDAVVNQRLYDRVAVTTPEIIEAGKKAGFDLTRVVDDLTERLYYAANILTDSSGMIIPTFAGNIRIADESLTGNPSSILNFSDGYYTVLPTTTFTIASNGLTCIPMTDGQVSAMAQMTDEQMVTELNKGTYVRQPFHIVLLTTPKSPQALIFNLLSPSMTSLVFIAENPHSAPQMSVTSCVVNHLTYGTGGYQILLGMTRSSNIEGVDPSNLHVFLTCRTRVGDTVYLPAQYVSTNDNGIDTWSIHLSTSYHITTDEHITVLMNDSTDTLGSVEISINQDFTIVTCFDQTYDPTVPIDVNLNLLLPPSQQATTVAMAQQTMTLSLGKNLSSQIYCGVNTSWGNDVYQVAESTVYYQNTVPIFQNTESGRINTRLNSSNQMEVVLLYPQGSTPSATVDLIQPTLADVHVINGATTTSITVNDPTGILVGMPARGTNIPVGTVVNSVTNNVVVLSKPITTTVVAGTQITFTNPRIDTRTKAVQPAVGKQLTITSTANLIVGQSVFGFDIPANAKVQSIDSATKFSLTIPTTHVVANNTLLTFINTKAPGVVKTAVGDIITDPTGAPVIIKHAQNQYLIPAILFDGRLFASQDPSDQQIITTISQYLQNFANQISTLDEGLIEDSHVFYKPSRTMGFATFGIGGGRTVNMKLELSFDVTIYVDVSVYNTQTLLSTMASSTVSIVNKAIQLPIISVSDITESIRTSLGSNVSAVEMGGISGTDLRLISLEDSGATPSIENLLTIQSDGSVARSPNVTITFLPKPDTAEATTLATL